MKKLWLMVKAFRQLGWAELGPWLRYKFQLWSGILRWKTPLTSYTDAAQGAGELCLPLFPVPDVEAYRALFPDEGQAVLRQADEILNRQVRLFGGEPVPLELKRGGKLRHWIRHTGSQHQGEDIKLVWEPARFGWGVTLGRAWLFSGDEKYAGVFWAYTEEFLAANPPNLGPQWASGQEVALRMMAIALAAGVMADSRHTTPERLNMLKGMIAAHADRIAATLDYARAQNNNHLISEAAGLYTAAALLPTHPRSEEWRRAGWEWLHRALQTQIGLDGSYVQHSSNYLRLVLQLALFVKQLSEAQGESFPAETTQRLGAAVHWLNALLDNDSGGVPNLGGNDGAYFLPLTDQPYADFRPVLNAAQTAFLGKSAPASEMNLWLSGVAAEKAAPSTLTNMLCLNGKTTWGMLRAARFEHRPAHADQLHLDLWWQGMNIAPDPGVYQYNADPPWHNPLDTTAMHNTLTLNDRPQMTKAGKFLWLDWAQAEVLDTAIGEDGELTWAVAQHDGYRKLRLVHRRTVSVEGDLWMVRDQVWPEEESSASGKPVTARLHWLLADLPWAFSNGVLRLTTEMGEIVLQVRVQDAEAVYSLVRAGEMLLGEGQAEPVRGWFSPTYAHKIPALSLAVSITTVPPVTITTNWQFPG